MRKRILIFSIMITSVTNAQYFEDFENGVPGTMTQNFQKGETTFIDFCIAAVGVENALSDKNSAVFANAMVTETTTTTLQTPLLYLSSKDFMLEFKHLQKSINTSYSNELAIELSSDFGKTWLALAVYKKPNLETDTEIIALDAYSTKNIIIRFKATLTNGNYDFPIVIDDISIQKRVQNSSKTSSIQAKNEQEKTNVYPNPTNGVFNINNKNMANITVIDFNGSKVLEIENSISETPINMSNYPKGMYIVRIENATTTETKKLILK